MKLKKLTDDMRRLTDDEWRRIAPLIPELDPDATTGYRRQRRLPTENDARIVLDAVLWILLTGNPWRAVASYYASGACYRAFRLWCNGGVMLQIAGVLRDEWPELGALVEGRNRNGRTPWRGDRKPRCARSLR